MITDASDIMDKYKLYHRLIDLQQKIIEQLI